MNDIITPVEKYNVVYADPPWDIKAGRELAGYVKKNGKQIFSIENDKSRDLEYPTMSVDEIQSLKVKDIVYDDAHLYMWVPNKYLPFAFEIIKSWGFKYSTTLVWAKNTMGGGLGGTFKINTEFLLFARKGSLKAKQINHSTWYNVKRNYENGYPKHSKKPYFFHELIEQTSPGNKIELFAREKRSGWDVWGNEVESKLKL